MLGFVRRRAFLTFLGFVLLAVFIWYAGPLFAFNDYSPLEPVNARIFLFVLIVVIWAALKAWKRLRAMQAGDRLVAAVVRQASPREERPSAEAVQLRERFETGVATLKQSRAAAVTACMTCRGTSSSAPLAPGRRRRCSIRG